MDGGTAGTYTARNIQVIKGTGGDSTNLAGVVSGSNSTDLIKSGTGTLQLTASNTYAGRTIIEGGTVQANTSTLVAGTSSATGIGNVIIATGGTLAGGTSNATGQVAGGVTVSGTITAGTGATTSDTIGKLSTGAETWVAGGTYAVKIGAANGSSDELLMSGLTNALTPASFTIQVTGLTSSTFASGNSYIIADDTTNNTINAFNVSTLTVTTVGTATPYSFSLSETGDGASGEDLILSEGTAAAPEPTSALLLVVAVSPLLLARRRRPLANAILEV